VSVPIFQPDTLPYRLRDYILVKRIGEGSQGSVYLARRDGDLGFNRMFALKIVGTMEPGGGRELQAIANEAQALAAIYHPNVVQVVDFRSDGLVFFLVMEYVRGVTVRRLLHRLGRRGKGLPVPETLSIARQVAQGLEALHHLRDEEGNPAPLVHRDLKPENIIISGTGLTKLVDFGVIQWEASSFDIDKKKGITRGTPNYMSPEQVVGRQLAPSSDLFSFGSVLFEMITGHILYGADDARSIMMRIFKGSPMHSPDLVNEKCPELLPILARCLNHDPAKRYESPIALADDLEAVRANVEIRSDLPSLLRRAGLKKEAPFQEEGAIPSRAHEPVLDAETSFVGIGQPVDAPPWARKAKPTSEPKESRPAKPVRRAPWERKK